MTELSESKIRIEGKVLDEATKAPPPYEMQVEVWSLGDHERARLLGETTTSGGAFEIYPAPGSLTPDAEGNEIALLFHIEMQGDLPVLSFERTRWRLEDGWYVLRMEVPVALQVQPAKMGEPEDQVAPDRAGQSDDSDAEDSRKLLESLARSAAATERIAGFAEYWSPTGNGHGGRTSAGAGTSGGSLSDIVAEAFAAVLGRSFSQDAEGARQLDDVLSMAFTPVEKEGHTEYQYNSAVALPFAIRTDAGAKVAGAQASLLDQFTTVIGRTQELLKTIKPLEPAPDNDEIEAVRTIVSTTLEALQREVGRGGGPLAPAVDNLFKVLYMQLDRWQKVFSLDREAAINIEREGSYTTFNTVRWNVRMLKEAWKRYKSDQRKTPYLGTQVTRLTDALDRVQQTVAATEQVMDALGFYRPDRRGTMIPFGDIADKGVAKVEMSVDAVLQGLVMDFTAMAHKLVTKTGLRGVEAIAGPARSIQAYVAALAEKTKPPALQHASVRRHLAELAEELDSVAGLAEKLAKVDDGKPPKVAV